MPSFLIWPAYNVPEQMYCRDGVTCTTTTSASAFSWQQLTAGSFQSMDRRPCSSKRCMALNPISIHPITSTEAVQCIQIG